MTAVTVYSAGLVVPITAPPIVDGAVAVREGRIMHVGEREWVLRSLSERGIDADEVHWPGVADPRTRERPHAPAVHRHGLGRPWPVRRLRRLGAGIRPGVRRRSRLGGGCGGRRGTGAALRHDGRGRRGDRSCGGDRSARRPAARHHLLGGDELDQRRLGAHRTHPGRAGPRRAADPARNRPVAARPVLARHRAAPGDPRHRARARRAPSTSTSERPRSRASSRTSIHRPGIPRGSPASRSCARPDRYQRHRVRRSARRARARLPHRPWCLHERQGPCHPARAPHDRGPVPAVERRHRTRGAADRGVSARGQPDRRGHRLAVVEPLARCAGRRGRARAHRPLAGLHRPRPARPPAGCRDPRRGARHGDRRGPRPHRVPRRGGARRPDVLRRSGRPRRRSRTRRARGGPYRRHDRLRRGPLRDRLFDRAAVTPETGGVS